MTKPSKAKANKASFSQTRFNQFILQHQLAGFFEQQVKLSSGRLTSWYINWRLISNDVYLLEQLANQVLSFVADHKIKFDCFYGTPDGATKLAVLCQYLWAKNQSDYQAGKYILPMGRKTPKDHGQPQDRFFVGAPAGKIIVLEDVTTTGSSLLKSVTTLLDLKLQVVAAIALTNRNELMDDGSHVSDQLKQIGVPYLALSEAQNFMPELVAQNKPSAKVKKLLQQEYQKYGQIKLKF